MTLKIDAKCHLFIQKGCEIIKQAVEKDNAEDYKKACSLYSMGIQYLITGLKYEKNAKVKTAIKEKVQKYLKRVENIKDLPSKTVMEPEIDHDIEMKSEKKLKTPTAYPTQHDANKVMNEVNKQTIHIIYGYIRQIEALLNVNICIPNGIINLCLIYYHIPNEYIDFPPSRFGDPPSKPNVKWDDIAGLKNVKDIVKELIILPLRFPQLFINKRSYRNNVLLYGPPGVGKSYLSQAVANEIGDATFFHVSIADLVSKYVPETERLVKKLFTMAREKKPSFIFADEIDALSPRCRITTEFLVQIQGVGKDIYVPLILAATNCPWDLHPAIRRRFVKRIYVPLPDKEARNRMFKIHIGKTPNSLSEQDYDILAEKTDGFSGSDISGVVQDALMEPVRNIQTATHFVKQKDPEGKYTYIWLPCSPETPNAVKMSLMEIPESEHNYIRAESLSIAHFLKILSNAKPSVGETDIERYREWTREFGEEV